MFNSIHFFKPVHNKYVKYKRFSMNSFETLLSITSLISNLCCTLFTYYDLLDTKT